MVYLNGDGNVAAYAKNELNEILSSEGKVEIFVLFDGDGDGDTTLYCIVNGTWETIEDAFDSPELDMGDARTLQDFVGYVFERSSSDHYLLEIWGHGNGWMGVCFDRTNRDMLTLAEIREAMKRKIDVIMFSACYMGGIEVAYEMEGIANYMVACEGALPAPSVPHKCIFDEIQDGMQPEKICSMIIEKYGENAGYLSTSFAAWNLSKMERMGDNLDAFVSALQNLDGDVLLSIRNTSAFSMNYMDLYGFAEQVYKMYGYEEAKNLMEKINETLVANYGVLKGMGIYFPLPDIFSTSYFNTEFSLSYEWDELINNL